MVKAAVNQDVLKWARESTHLSIEDVASKLRKLPETILSWEKGESSPTYVQLEKLAYQIYKRPIAIFFFPTPPDEENPATSFRTLPDSEIDRLPPTVIRLLRQAQAMQINLDELCESENPAPQRIFEDISVDLSMSPDLLSEIVRKYIGVDLEEQTSWESPTVALANWRNCIEENGIYVFKDAFRENKISGFCLYDSEFPVIFINNSMPKTRQIFTLFHELAHLLFRTGGIDKVNDDYLSLLSGNNLLIERFCDKFAAELLVPDSDFVTQMNFSSIDEFAINKFAARYSVSREVVLLKLLDHQFISSSFYEDKVNQWKRERNEQKKNRSDSGNYYATKVTYLGKNYLRLVFGKYYKNHIDTNQLADFLNVKVSNIPSLESAFNR